ncbi:hypothetical protein BGZ65_001287, partial [Modicella reniformis]
ASYTGTLCKPYIPYDVWLPPNQTVATIEAKLNTMGLNSTSLSQLTVDCYEPFMEYLCSSSFPKVEAVVGT